jgi:hypothetical protein
MGEMGSPAAASCFPCPSAAAGCTFYRMLGPRDLIHRIPDPLPVHDKAPAAIIGFVVIIALFALAIYLFTRKRARLRRAYFTQPPPRAVATARRRHR